jgi:hypothetical protein
VSLFTLGFWIRWRETAARKWPQSSGVIVTSKIEWKATGRGGQEAFPVVEYEFNHEGRSFKSSHWCFGNFTIGDRMSAEAITSRYPVGASVIVFVNSRQPMKSVLEHNPSSLSWVAFGFGVFFLSIFILILLVILNPQG